MLDCVSHQIQEVEEGINKGNEEKRRKQQEIERKLTLRPRIPEVNDQVSIHIVLVLGVFEIS